MRGHLILSGITTFVIPGLLLAACGRDRPTAPVDLPLGEASRYLEVAMRDIAFAPTTLEARAGEIVEIALRNGGSLPHDFTVDMVDADVAVTRPAGRAGKAGTAVHVALDGRGESALQLRVRQAGEYEFYCSITGHRRAGMRGVLVILE